MILSMRYRDIVLSSVAAADHQHHPLGVAGEVERGLAGRVRRADDVDLVALALAGLAGVRAVVDAAAGELVEPRRLQAPVGDAGRDDERAGLDLARTFEQYGAHRPAGLEADDVAREHHLGTETGSLGDGALGEVGAGQAPSGTRGSSRSPRSARPGRPGASRSTMTVLRPSDAAYTAAARPAGPPPTMHTSYSGCSARGAQPERGGELERRRRAERVTVRDEHQRQVGRRSPARGRAAAGPRRRARRRTSGTARGCGPGTS